MYYKLHLGRKDSFLKKFVRAYCARDRDKGGDAIMRIPMSTQLFSLPDSIQGESPLAAMKPTHPDMTLPQLVSQNMAVHTSLRKESAETKKLQLINQELESIIDEKRNQLFRSEHNVSEGEKLLTREQSKLRNANECLERQGETCKKQARLLRNKISDAEKQEDVISNLKAAVEGLKVDKAVMKEQIDRLVEALENERTKNNKLVLHVRKRSHERRKKEREEKKEEGFVKKVSNELFKLVFGPTESEASGEEMEKEKSGEIDSEATEDETEEDSK